MSASSPIWTDAALAYLTEAWPAGKLTAVQIGQELSHLTGLPVSKGAVLGKCWRLGLIRAKPAGRPKAQPKVKPKSLLHKAPESCGSTNALPLPDLARNDAAGSGGQIAPPHSPSNARRWPHRAVADICAIAVHPPGEWPLLALKSRQCRFACTPHDAQVHGFCGDKTEPGCPYCARHARIAYRETDPIKADERFAA